MSIELGPQRFTICALVSILTLHSLLGVVASYSMMRVHNGRIAGHTKEDFLQNLHLMKLYAPPAKAVQSDQAKQVLQSFAEGQLNTHQEI